MLSKQEAFILSPYIELYNQLIPSEHLLRQFNELIDFSFVYDELAILTVWTTADRPKAQSLCLSICY